MKLNNKSMWEKLTQELHVSYDAEHITFLIRRNFCK